MGYLSFIRANLPFVGAGALISFSSSYGQTFFVSLFAAQIMAAFGLTDGQWGGIYTVATMVSAIAMIWAGVLVDHLRIRTLAVAVMGGLAVICLAMAVNSSVWVLGGLIFALRFFGQGLMSHLAIVAMARWFVASRGKALSMASMGFSTGTAVLPVIFAALLAMVDWRWLWVLAAAMVLTTLPIVHRLLRAERTPQSLAQEDQSFGMGGRHWTRAEVLRHPVFWLIVPALIGPPAWGTALLFQQVHLTEVKGWSLVAFTALFPLLSVMAVTASITAGGLVDRFGATRLIPACMLPFALCFALMTGAQGISAAGVALAVFGVGQGMQATIPGAFWAELFGTRHIGAIKSAAGAIMVFGSAIGPGVSGALIDRGWDFPAQMPWLAGYFIVAAGLAFIATLIAPRGSALAA